MGDLHPKEQGQPNEGTELRTIKVYDATVSD